MQEFLLLANEIVKHYRAQVNSSVVPTNRLKHINDMKTELQALKDAFGVVAPQSQTDSMINNALQS